MTSKLTREELLNIIETDHVQCGEASALARMALAAMDSEPVAWMHNNNNIGIPAITTSPKIGQYWMTEFKDVHPLYRHAQPALTPYAWSYDWACCVTCEGPQDFEPVIEREPPPQWAIDEGRVKNLITLYRTAQPAPVVQCPFPCGWDNLNKLAIQNAAFVACALIAGEPATESLRQAAISNNDYLLKVISACRAAMLNGGKS